MYKSIWTVGTLLALAGTPALPHGLDYPYDADDYAAFSHYHPFRVHIAGGPTITQGNIENNLDNGWNAGAGLTWYPSSHLPLGLRLDGSYNQFNGRRALLSRASTTLGTRVDEATVKIWGGDADLQIDFHLGYTARMYLLAGVGWYDEQDTYRQLQAVSGTHCNPLGCGPGTTLNGTIVARNTTGLHFAKNAGIGAEFAIGGRGSFFVEARYMRINPSQRRTDFLPIRFGLRF